MLVANGTQNDQGKALGRGRDGKHQGGEKTRGCKKEGKEKKKVTIRKLYMLGVETKTGMALHDSM